MSIQAGFVPALATSTLPTRGNPFRVILWKELREGWKSGLMALVIVGCSRLFSLGIDSVETHSGTDVMVAVSGGAAPSFFTFTTALAGLLIGGACMMRERRGDMRAFLVHRPVEPSLLFWGKVLASSIWYLLAAFLPLAVYAVVRLDRGASGVPFLPAMLLPDVADAFTGFAYLLAGMLIIMRRARWFGSRLAPIGGALVASVFVVSTPSFSIALLDTAVALAVLAVAARATFIAGGYYEPQSTPQRALLGLTVACGITLFGATAMAIVDTIVEIGTLHRDGWRVTELRVASDGSLVWVTRDHKYMSERSTVVSVRDTSGTPIVQRSDSAPQLSNGRSVNDGVISTANIPLNPAADYTSTVVHGYRGTDDLYVPLFFGGRFGQVFWFYLRGAHVIDVYDIRDQRSVHVGWLGPDGYLPGETMPTRRFIGELRPNTEYSQQQPIIAFPTEVYRIDPRTRAIRRVFTAPVGEEVLGAATSGDSTANSKYPASSHFDAIATTQHLYVQNSDGSPQLDLARDSMASRYGSVRVVRPIYAPDSVTLVWYHPRFGTLSREQVDTARDQISKFSRTGQQLSHASFVAEVPTAASPRTQWIQIALEGFTQGVTVHAFELWQERRDVVPRLQVRGLPLIVGWVASIFGSLFAAIVIAVITRRYAFDTPRRSGWIVSGLLGGPFVVLLLLSLPEWPARERCPNCRAKRVVTRDRCEHCGAPFAPPPRNGTEIFEEALSS